MRPSSLSAVIALLGIPCLLPTARAVESQSVHLFERAVTGTGTVRYDYLLAMPAGYDARHGKEWPLILFLHGAGERGDDVWAVAKHGPPKLLRGQNRDAAGRKLAENFVVLSPQCPRGKWWDAETLLALLDDVMSTHQVDPRRVYLTGLSMGAYGAWNLGTTYPERFAAIAPVSGGGRFAPVFAANTHKRRELRTLGVWAFHGAKDRAVRPIESQRMVDLLMSFRVEDVQLTVYPEAKHDAWTDTYANPELYAWLLRHERAPQRESK